MAFEVKITGADEILRKLRMLPERIGNNAMRRSLRKGANVIRDIAKVRAQAIDDPQTRENISKNIAVASGGKRREKQAGGPMMRVGVRGGARLRRGDNGAPGGNTTYWRLLEYGWSGAPAQPFMRPAAAEGASKAIGVIVEDMKVQLDREISKLR